VVCGQLEYWQKKGSKEEKKRKKEEGRKKEGGRKEGGEEGETSVWPVF
jgi:hypothetical protein